MRAQCPEGRGDRGEPVLKCRHCPHTLGAPAAAWVASYLPPKLYLLITFSTFYRICCKSYIPNGEKRCLFTMKAKGKQSLDDNEFLSEDFFLMNKIMFI